MSREELNSSDDFDVSRPVMTRAEVITQLQQSDNFISAIQQVTDDYNIYQDNYELSCNTLTPLTATQLKLLAIGCVKHTIAEVKAVICHFLASGETELLTLSEYGILLTVTSLYS